MNSKGCPICGASVDNRNAYCSNCGHPMWDLPAGYQIPPRYVDKPDLFCPACGVGAKFTNEFCPHCGTDLHMRALLGEKPPPASGCWQAFAILLFIFVGVPAALLGGCVLIFTVAEFDWAMAATSVGFIALSGALLVFLVKTLKG